jgi:hypothetical protein
VNMGRLIALAFLMVSPFTLVGTSWAGPKALSTAPVPLGPDQAIECEVANVGTSVVQVIIELIDGAGVGTRSATSTIAPDVTSAVGLLPNTSPDKCKFIAAPGVISNLRGALVVRNTTSPFDVATAIPAFGSSD